MTNHIQLDYRDKKAFTKLDQDFKFSDDGTIAMVSGLMKVTIVRLADDDGSRFQLTIEFPGSELFAIFLSRQRTLEQLGIAGDDGTPV
jgi:hypothetical protein